MNEAEITGLSIACLAGVLVAGLTTVLDRLLRWAGRAVPEVFVEDCTMLHDCDGCDEYGAPMVVDEDVARPYMSAQWWMDQPPIELPITPAGIEELEELWRRS